ncbi:OLC1v1002143C1 [Oldenlandia corymbosa var. corymbosa]|uniref:OLC1v1002143C1 n=1 Tax=Oldenlandia corymbosa var. corymbosa TaxID=529605 RepID=A0AAV1D7N3_OLDCO|nr:OLC1v1002143C1 [Oldenlandia corymbosa var. corymbosa]
MLPANVIAENEDLLTRILVHLPAESLIRFRSVSKTWLSIISDPNFRRCLRRHTGAYFLVRPGQRRGEPELNFVSVGEGYVNSMNNIVSNLGKSFGVHRIQGFHSCNGLVVLALDINAGESLNFVVYNPTTRRRRLIPDYFVDDSLDSTDTDSETDDPFSPLSSPDPTHFYALNIAFDPLQSDDYELVYVFDDGNERIRFASYTSETGLWTNSKWYLDQEREGYSVIWFEKGVFWNGGMFWVGSCWDVYYFDFETNDGECIIPSFPQGRSFEEREDDFMCRDVLFFGVSGENLCLIVLMDLRPLRFEVYNFELEYSRWTLMHGVRFSALTGLYPSMLVKAFHPCFPHDWHCSFSFLSFLVDEEQKQSQWLISVPGKIISCNTHPMTVKEVADVVTENFGKVRIYEWRETFEHVETFASV